MGATQEQRNLHCGFVRCDDEAMKSGHDVPPQAREGQMLRFTTTITVSEFIVNSCSSSSNFCTLPLQQVTVPILKMPRYGGKCVGFNALDAEDQHVRALMLAFQDEELDLNLAEEAIADALYIANTLWTHRYNNQPCALVDEAETIIKDDEMIDEFDLEDAEVDEEVVEPDVADTLDVDDEVIVEPFVMAAMTAVGVASVDDGMGSVWVVPDDSVVRVLRSGRVVAASDSLGTCWIWRHGCNLCRSRRLR